MVGLPAVSDLPGVPRAVRSRPRKKLQDVARALSGKGQRTGGVDRGHVPDATVSAADFLRDGGDADADPEVEIVEVLEDNWIAVQVFRNCKPEWLTGMHAPFYAGISSQEIESTARLLGVATDDQDLIACVRLMEEETKRMHNPQRPQ
ncbi:MAG: DUF1799 domain-containing protein [Luteimonas sp.]|nr:DUF1799 domain-containing protein [Luteimonas sp.]